MKNFQRDGVVSNAHAGRDFESATKDFFATEGIQLSFDLALPIGVGDVKKEHTFDLGNREGRVIVECKSHTWTEGGMPPVQSSRCGTKPCTTSTLLRLSTARSYLFSNISVTRGKKHLASTILGLTPILYLKGLKCGNMMKGQK